jgi:predicted Fe-Mo cluster-binding NifX family protein
MKVVVTSTGTTLDDPVDTRFGRASHFLFVDTESEEVRPVDNSQNLNAMQGAGVQAAQTVADLAPEYVVTGHCGPKAFAVLKAAGVRVVLGVEGTVREALGRLERGELKPSENPDVEGHWV